MSWMSNKVGGLVAVVRSLYSRATISIRLSIDGDLTPSFVQKKGTRQGSGLSSCIFTIPVVLP